tara:strand:- start:7870 stop:8160 length:291 start_codon:yes stop_codon:yes gene_type:complete
MTNNCCSDLQKLQTQFQKLQKQFKLLLQSAGNSNMELTKLKTKKENNNVFYNAEDPEQNLIRKGYSPRVVKRVASKMRSSGRPATDYSKRTGNLKK